MSPRPQTVSNADILRAAGRAISRVGPARLTLAEVAREAGLAPATLVQRFGSKRGLLVAFAEHAAANVGGEFRAARAAHETPLEALVAVHVARTRHVETPEALANNLALFQLDLTDPELYVSALEHARATEGEIRSLLDEAVAAGQLTPSDTSRLARSVQVAYNGALVTWAIYREGSISDWVHAELERLLRPHR